MVAVAILAAGRGTRMKSSLPKVLHSLGGRSLLERVLHSCSSLSPERYFAIVGYEAQRVRDALQGFEMLEFVEQTQQLGTGHAIQQLLPHLKGFQGDVVVLNGDVPLLRQSTLEQLVRVHQTHKNAATLLTAQLPNPQGYGRVFGNGDNLVQQIVEDRDCTDAQRHNHRINAGVYCFNWPALAEVLPKLTANNDQQEYYLTDVFSEIEPVMAVDVDDCQEIMGINDRSQLAAAYEILQMRIKEAWMAAGVTLIDPGSITIDDTVELAPDTIIEPQTHLRGNTKIASNCRIGPGSLIENSEIGENVTAMYSVVRDSAIAPHTQVGPYAHLRGGRVLGKDVAWGTSSRLKRVRWVRKRMSRIYRTWAMQLSASA